MRNARQLSGVREGLKLGWHRELLFFCFFVCFKILFMYLFLERGEGREGEKHQCVVASHAPPTGDLAPNTGMCPDLGIELANL